MLTAIIILVVLTLLVLAVRRGTRPKIHRNVPLADLRAFVVSLPAQMGDGSVLIADRRDGDGFLQLALRSFRDRVLTVEFGLPKVGWSTDRFDVVVDGLRRAGFGPTLEAGSGVVSAFARVTINGAVTETTDRAMSLLALVAEGLGWGSSPTFDVQLQGPLDRHRVKEWAAASTRRDS